MFSIEEYEREHKEEIEQRRKELTNILEQENFKPRNRAERRKAMKNRRNNGK